MLFSHSLLQASVPLEALRSTWTEENRKHWGVKLSKSTTVDEILQVLCHIIVYNLMLQIIALFQSFYISELKTHSAAIDLVRESITARLSVIKLFDNRGNVGIEQYA